MPKSKITVNFSDGTKNLITALALVLAFPVGLVLMWFWTNWPRWFKIVITAVPILVILLISSAIALLISLLFKGPWHASQTPSQVVIQESSSSSSY